MEADALLLRIQEAFASVPRPSEHEIAPHRCQECDELRNDLAPYDANAVPLEILRKHVWDLPLLSAEAKQYFLPAWLSASVLEGGTNFTEATIQDIDSNHRYDPSGGYTDEQWQVLLAWRDHQAETGDSAAKESAHSALRGAGRSSEA